MEKKFSRSGALGFVALLYLQSFIDWLKGPSPWEEQEGPAEKVLFWILVPVVLFLFYLWASWECALGRECYVANASLANWLFGK